MKIAICDDDKHALFQINQLVNDYSCCGISEDKIEVRSFENSAKLLSKIESVSTISQVDAILLIDKRFIKPHRSFIVNLDYIQSLLKDGFVTINGLFIPISRNVYKEVKQAYIDHSFQTKD